MHCPWHRSGWFWTSECWNLAVLDLPPRSGAGARKRYEQPAALRRISGITPSHCTFLPEAKLWLSLRGIPDLTFIYACKAMAEHLR